MQSSKTAPGVRNHTAKPRRVTKTTPQNHAAVKNARELGNRTHKESYGGRVFVTQATHRLCVFKTTPSVSITKPLFIKGCAHPLARENYP